MDREGKLAHLAELRAEMESLEAELHTKQVGPTWPPKRYYATYHILAGMVLGLIAASTSLLLNIVCAPMFGKHPLELIRIYLTFPMGAKAMDLDTSENGFILAAGCCLYLGTGMIGGIPFHMILSRFFDKSTFGKRFAVATMLGIGVWLINYYGILYWLQPLLIDGNRYIVDQIPIVVAVMTHLVFGWTMLLVDEWGRFVPYHTNIEEPEF